MKKFDNNTPFSKKIIGNYSSLKSKFNWFKIYGKTFKDPISISWNVINNKFPMEIRLIDGTKITVKSKDEVSLYCFLKSNSDLEYFPENDSVIFPLPWNRNKKIKLFGISKGVDALLTFTENGVYEKLNVKNKTVVDIGGNIGDTAIYFALRGAKKVISLEPFPQNHKLAIKNIEANDCTDKITMLLAGCSSKIDHIVIDPDFVSDIRSTLQNFEKGISVPLLTLEEILTKNKISDVVLKMDCESCEYDSILSASKNTLERFEQMQIEYHNGYNNLKNKLENCNFRVYDRIIDTSHRGHIEAIKKR